MTANQLRYWELQESKRSNLARETETNRSNVRNEDLKEDIQGAQKDRWKVQNVTDVVKTVTGGLKDLSEAGKNTANIVTQFMPKPTLLGNFRKLLGGR